MAQNIKEFAKERLSTLTGAGSIAVAPTGDAPMVPGQTSLTGQDVKRLTKAVEEGLLAQDAEATYHALDELTHMLEMQVERTRDRDQPVRSVTWQTGVARLVAARSQHATLRIPGFIERFDQPTVVPLSLAGRMFEVLGAFTELTRLQMVTDGAPLTPENWLTLPTAVVAMRNNLGVSYYHLSRLLEVGAQTDSATLAARDVTFSENFDVMFYAFTYGPLMSEAQSDVLMQMLSRHLETVEAYLQSPQPSLRSEPERFDVSASHVAHILSTVDRAQTVYSRFTA